MRKLFLALLGVLIVIFGGFILYPRTYAIANDKKQLEANIVQFINRPTVITNHIEIKQELNLDNKKYVLFVVNNSLGDAELIKGLNNKFKIESAGYGSSYFTDKIRKTNKGRYLILEGKNYYNRISYTKVLFQ